MALTAKQLADRRAALFAALDAEDQRLVDVIADYTPPPGASPPRATIPVFDLEVDDR